MKKIKDLIKPSIVLGVFLIQFNLSSQTIPSTGSGFATCGDCTPTGWTDNGGTPDISNQNISGGNGSVGGGSPWVNAPLPLPPIGNNTWITMRDVGDYNSQAEESVKTTMSGIVAGKIYRLTIYSMTAITDNSVDGSYFAGAYADSFDYEIQGTRQTIGSLSQNKWAKNEIFFIGAPDGSGHMDVAFYPLDNAVTNGSTQKIEAINIAVELNALELLDTDGDGIDDNIDIDDDNDGILDVDESGGNDPNGDSDGDKLPNYLDPDSSYNYDTDNDGISNHIDLDSDGDGIPDNIEAQPTLSYIAPSGAGSGITDNNNNGLDDNYETSQGGTNLTPPNTDSPADAIPDYLDTDSDNDGALDSIEANLSIGGSVGANGLYNTLDNGDNYNDVNGIFDNTQADNFIDADNDVNSGGDVDYRDSDQTGNGLDTDLDGISNVDDLDDDNDGITDAQELCNADFTTGATINVYVDLGDYESENSWTLTGPGGFSQSGGPYSSTDDVINLNFNATATGAYVFTLSDTYGDGLDGSGGSNSNGTSSYRISVNNAVQFQSGNLPTFGNGASAAVVNFTISSFGSSFPCFSTDPGADDDADGIINYSDADYDTGVNGDSLNSNGVWSSLDFDNDGVPNHLDLDSDNDGIPDNIEAQATSNSTFISPSGSGSGITDNNNNGLDDNYETGQGGTTLSPVNTDSASDSQPDYKDKDSDNDGVSDRIEANLSLSGSYGVNGLDANYESADNYADTNGTFDNTQEDNFPNSTGSGDVDYRDVSSSFSDNDGDGIPDNVDVDDDNDGILDTVEDAGGSVGTCNLTYRLVGTIDGARDRGAPDNLNKDFIFGDNYSFRISFDTATTISIETTIGDNNISRSGTVTVDGTSKSISTSAGNFQTVTHTPSAATSYDITMLGTDMSVTKIIIKDYQNTIIARFDFGTTTSTLESGYTRISNSTSQTTTTYSCSQEADADGDGIVNSLDLDSDNDGIPDNIEAQTTTGYNAPSGDANTTANGLDTAYGTGLIPEDTDGDGIYDYLDLDADNDGILDQTEAGLTLSGNVGNNGLDNNYDNGDNYSDVNGSFDNSQINNFPDADSDVSSGGDVDYRDDTFTYDNDNDNVNDEIDLDDDNDGILDSVEYGTCTPNSAVLNWDNSYVEGGTSRTNGEDPITTNSSLTVNNVGISLGRTSNVNSDSNYRINDLVTTSSSYTFSQKARTNAESGHIFNFDTPIYGLKFILYDVDMDSSTATDQVEIILTKQNGTNYTLTASDYAISAGSNFLSAVNTFKGNTQSGNGNVTINAIPQWIIRMRITYKNTGSGSLDGNQQIAIGNLSFCTPIDSDSDGIFDFRDLDSDGDGIPDNIESQTTKNYIAPTGNYTITGIDLAFGTGFTPVDTDGDNEPDYLDLNSDNEGGTDFAESGLAAPSGTVGNNGLDSNYEASDAYDTADINGAGDNTITDNFTDSDGDVNSPGGDLDYRDSVTGIDTDNDGIDDSTDLDDDNDGIPDSIEGTVLDTDGDGILNYLDIDSDNDGIPDNVEAQSTLTANYISPSGIGNGITDNNNNGLDDNYETAQGGTDITLANLVNTDSGNDTIPDYLDSDSDNDGTPDIEENGDSDNVISGTDTDGDGLDDNFEGNNVSDGYDVNDEIDTPQTDLPDVDSDVATQDVDYRDAIVNEIEPSPIGQTLWLRADKGITGGSDVSLWEDQTQAQPASTIDFIGSGTQKPSSTSTTLNFNPVVTFTPGNNDVLTYTGNLNPRSLYIVYNDLSTANWTTPFTNNDSNGIGHGDDPTNVYDATYTPAVVRGGQQFVNGLTTTLTSHARPDNFELISNLFSGEISNASHTYYVGRDRTQTGRTINGSVAEVMLFSEAHSLAKKQQIESYLAIKYGFTLSSTNSSGSIIEGDYILSDLTTKVWNYTNNSSFHNDVAGIGRDDGMAFIQKQSKSQNQDSEVHLTIGLGSIASSNAANGNSFNSNKNFLMWGNNNGSLSTTTTNTIICAPEKTMNRTWKIVERGSVGSVQIAFDAATINAALNTSASLKVLKVADDVNFTTNVKYSPITSTTVNGSTQYVTNYDFNGTKYFTYAEVNGIFWNGDANSGAGAWTGGSAGDNSASTNGNDLNKVMVIDSETSLNHAVLNQDARVECVWIKNNSVLSVADNHYLEFDEDFILDGNLKLIGNAQLVQTHVGQTNVQGTGKVYLDQKATVPNQYRYHYWTSPVVEVGKSTFTVGGVMKDGTTPTSLTSTAQTPKDINFVESNVSFDGDYTTSPITIANTWIYSYRNGTTREDWVQKKNSGNLNRGEGYTMKSTGNSNGQNFTFVGTPNDGLITIPVTANTNSLIGNPYPSAVDAVDFIYENLGVFNGTIYFWQHKGEASTSSLLEGHFTAGYQGGYATRNLITSVAAQAVSGEITGGLGIGNLYDAPGRYIAVGQSFFVGAISTGNIVFKNSQRNYKKIDGSNSIFLKSGKNKTSKKVSTEKEENLDVPTLKIGFEYLNDNNVEIHRQIAVSFKNGLTEAYEEGYDSFIYDLQPNDSYWKFNGSDNKYVIAGIGMPTGNTEIPISLQVDSEKEVKLMIDNLNFVNNDIYLKDNVTGISRKLSNSETVDLTLPIGTYEDRFYITFKEDATLEVVEEESNEHPLAINVYFDKLSNEIKIIKEDTEIVSSLKLINMAGQVLKEVEFKTPTNGISVEGISDGIYIVKLKTSNGIVSKKIAIY
ncbi:T9SS type A sorting domain-containing protein [Flavicella sediminum]|uniref:T9SS type A sorting domain-containing protein n=1 Tax=Flavicella sediminum TaxID=2585141 RepID=UPI00111DCBB7|nr:T9SS type A sorting domain-containing protein [Flavicella sediminum]